MQLLLQKFNFLVLQMSVITKINDVIQKVEKTLSNSQITKWKLNLQTFPQYHETPPFGR